MSLPSPPLGRAVAALALRVTLLSCCLALTACGSEASSSRWEGKTYSLVIPPANWVQPKGIGRDIGDFVPDFLIGLEAAGAGNLRVTVGTAADGAQDGCNVTTTVSMSGAQYPSTEIVVPAFPMRLVDAMHGVVVNTIVHDLTITNVLPADMPAEEGTLAAIVDVGELYPLFTKIPDVTRDAVCKQLADFGAPCEVCAFNGTPYCLALTAVQIGAVQSPTRVRPIVTAEVPASCATVVAP